MESRRTVMCLPERRKRRKKSRKRRKKRTGEVQIQAGQTQTSSSQQISKGNRKQTGTGKFLQLIFVMFFNSLNFSFHVFHVSVLWFAVVCPGPVWFHWEVVSAGWMTSSHPRCINSAWTVKQTQPTGRTSLCTEETS